MSARVDREGLTDRELVEQLGDPFEWLGEEPFAAFGDPEFGSRPKLASQPLRGYANWRPARATRVVLGQVDEVLAEYSQYLPLTIRQVFYRLVGAHGYEKSERAYKRLVYVLGRARRARMIDFAAIRDDGVVTAFSRFHESPEAFWDECGERARGYRCDRQAGQSVYVELWTEAAGMIPQLSRIAHDYSVQVYSAGGFASLTAVRQIASRACERTVPTVLLHVGDRDPSGESVFRALAEDAAAFVQADRIVGTLRIEAVRVALTEAQITAHNLPTVPAKSSDSRTRNWTGDTCQLEALPPDQLARIVRAAIEDQLDMAKVRRHVAQEKRDRTGLLRALPRGSA